MDWSSVAKAAQHSMRRRLDREQWRRVRPPPPSPLDKQLGEGQSESDADYVDTPPRVSQHSERLNLVLGQIREALTNPDAVILIEKAIFGALEEFPNIARAVQSHYNAVVLMKKVKDKSCLIDRRSLVATMLADVAKETHILGVIQSDLQSVGGVSDYCKKAYAINPNSPQVTGNATVSNIEAEVLVR